jgi:hypothetical protein
MGGNAIEKALFKGLQTGIMRSSRRGRRLHLPGISVAGHLETSAAAWKPCSADISEEEMRLQLELFLVSQGHGAGR